MGGRNLMKLIKFCLETLRVQFTPLLCTPLSSYTEEIEHNGSHSPRSRMFLLPPITAIFKNTPINRILSQHTRAQASHGNQQQFFKVSPVQRYHIPRNRKNSQISLTISELKFHGDRKEAEAFSVHLPRVADSIPRANPLSRNNRHQATDPRRR